MACKLQRRYFNTVQLDEKIRQLCAHLLRAENPEVIEEVAAQLHAAVDEFVQKHSTPAIVLEAVTPM